MVCIWNRLIGTLAGFHQLDLAAEPELEMLSWTAQINYHRIGITAEGFCCLEDAHVAKHEDVALPILIS